MAEQLSCRCVFDTRRRLPRSWIVRADREFMEQRLLIFDVEGTLVDCVQETLHCWRETFKSFGFDFSISTLHKHSGRDSDDMIRALLSASDADRLASTLKKAQGKRYRQHYLPGVKPFPKVRPLFARLRDARHKIALATSCAKDELRHYMEITGISGLIDAIACGEDVRHEKPHPDLIRLTLARARSVHAIMVGDTPFDAKAAHAAGISSIGMLTGGFSATELKRAGCSAVYADPAQLLEEAPVLLFGSEFPGRQPASCRS